MLVVPESRHSVQVDDSSTAVADMGGLMNDADWTPDADALSMEDPDVSLLLAEVPMTSKHYKEVIELMNLDAYEAEMNELFGDTSDENTTRKFVKCNE